MKRVLLFTFCLLCSMTLFASSGKTIIKGQVPRYEGKGYLLLINNETRGYDTLSVRPDGTFAYELTLDKPVQRGLYLEYLNDDRGVIGLYLKPGCDLQVNVSGSRQTEMLFDEEYTHYKLSAFFKGKTKKECEYLAIPTFYNYRYTDSEGKAVTYQQYLDQVKEQQNMRYAKLKGTDKAFYEQYAKEIEAMIDDVRFTYAWRLLAKGLDPSQDKDFTAFVDGIDLNQDLSDENAIDPNGGDLVSSKIRYILRMHPELYQGKTGTVRTLSYLRDNVRNANTREQLSDATMHVLMAIGGEENLGEAWEIYKQLSGKSEIFKANEKVYNSLSKLNPGVEATDFEMQDTEGRAVRFWDVIKRGKITYIDFWATWCGPCCAEIPFVEKLVEKYKGNDKIQFVSISLDNDLKKWHGKLDRDKPTWEQYVIPDNFNSKFAKEYNIQGIPRFMIFDGKGCIININADRPSSPSIEDVLNQLIH